MADSSRDPELWDECGDTLIFFGRGYGGPLFLNMFKSDGRHKVGNPDWHAG